MSIIYKNIKFTTLSTQNQYNIVNQLSSSLKNIEANKLYCFQSMKYYIFKSMDIYR